MDLPGTVEEPAGQAKSGNGAAVGDSVFVPCASTVVTATPADIQSCGDAMIGGAAGTTGLFTLVLVGAATWRTRPEAVVLCTSACMGVVP
jgi:hypothetical protein